ncbi:MAG: hypothetical protein ACFFBH_14865 [Promethearchaeota archaeon]
MNLKIIKNLLKKAKNPIDLRDFLLYKLCAIIYRKNNGFYIFDESWDNLIILDACRYDTFEEQYIKRKMHGQLTKKISRGDHTISFLLENFTKDYYEDIIYLTANPYVNRYLKDKFFKIVSVWKDGWSEEYHTVLPETMYNYTINTFLRYPDKKYIIHFMQPHFPYIDSNIVDKSLEKFRDPNFTGENYKLSKDVKKSIWSLYSADIYAMIEYKNHLRMYKKNLNLTLPYVENLINLLPGISVVSADHGEAFKEKMHPLVPFNFYGHRRGIRMPSLINIPWLIIKPEEKDKTMRNKLLEEELIRNKVNKLKKQGLV